MEIQFGSGILGENEKMVDFFLWLKATFVRQSILLNGNGLFKQIHWRGNGH
jgi:hypothetical protein